MHGFYRIAAAGPRLKVGDVAANTAAVLALRAEAEAAGCAMVVYPELCLTGYTCADLFQQTRLQQAARAALLAMAESSAGSPMIEVVGLPLLVDGRLYNVAVVIQDGRIHGVVPKSFLPTYKEFYEQRWFTAGLGVTGQTVRLGDHEVPFGVDLLFGAGEEFILGLEICEDLWTVTPPSGPLALAGATVIANPSASDELVGKAEYRESLVAGQSARCVCAYAYASCGAGESTTDVVYGGHAMIAENGAMLANGERFQRDASLLTADVDCQRLIQTRITETSFGSHPRPDLRRVTLAPARGVAELRRVVDAHPFVPANPDRREARCREILQIQATGLANRLEHIGAASTVIGISGGLDSTLALLVCREAWRLLGHDCERIQAVTMPGFGTTDRTYTNAVALCRQLGTQLREVDIKPGSLQGFVDIGHDPEQHDVTYENVQARLRTEILMNLANKHGGIVVGTGDLSEIALGWCTYNGDHMSMYSVNCGVPKSLIKYVIQWVADHDGGELRDTLYDVLDTPITPELLPKSADGQLVQKTEETVGPYELHDFFLYHAVKYGAPPEKIRFLAGEAFGDRYDAATILKWLRKFYWRFFANQFKRSCIPDGPKVGSIALSPRGDWRMPSDASVRLWLDGLGE